jgi:hypothetical protein
MQGMLSRGKNVYNAGAPQAQMGGAKGMGRPAEALARLEQARNLAKTAREASVQIGSQPTGPRVGPLGMQGQGAEQQAKQLAMQQGAVRQAQPVGQQLPGNAPAQANMQAMQEAMMRRVKSKLGR